MRPTIHPHLSAKKCGRNVEKSARHISRKIYGKKTSSSSSKLFIYSMHSMQTRMPTGTTCCGNPIFSNGLRSLSFLVGSKFCPCIPIAKIRLTVAALGRHHHRRTGNTQGNMLESAIKALARMLESDNADLKVGSAHVLASVARYGSWILV